MKRAWYSLMAIACGGGTGLCIRDGWYWWAGTNAVCVVLWLIDYAKCNRES